MAEDFENSEVQMSLSDRRVGWPSHSSVSRGSEREFTVCRAFADPVQRVFEAWTNPDLLMRWWAPRSFGMTIIAFEADVRTGGQYRLDMKHPSAEQPMSFFGKYLEVLPNHHIMWTNDEGDSEGQVTTVTFQEQTAGTLVTVTELYPSKNALNDANGSGSTSGWDEQLCQLEELLTQARPPASL